MIFFFNVMWLEFEVISTSYFLIGKEDGSLLHGYNCGGRRTFTVSDVVTTTTMDGRLIFLFEIFDDQLFLL